jgi:DNA polymerase-3 subunit gamma/tau
MSNPSEFYRKYRPKSFKDLLGQDESIQMLTDMGKNKRIPHAILISGPSGCGKTTIARILKDKLKCSTTDYREINSANFRGIDTVRDIDQRMRLAPFGGNCRIYMIDEAHQITRQAQEALLKCLEDTPDHVYFILATTEPDKLIRTIRTRCTEIRVKLLTSKDTHQLIDEIAKKENLNITKAVKDEIYTLCDGSARKALVLLNKIAHLEDEQTQIDLLQQSSSEKYTDDLAKAILNRQNKWPDIAKILQRLEEDPETVRRKILGYMTAVLLGKNTHLHEIAFATLSFFRDNWYDCGKAGLVSSCYEIFSRR